MFNIVDKNLYKYYEVTVDEGVAVLVVCPKEWRNSKAVSDFLFEAVGYPTLEIREVEEIDITTYEDCFGVEPSDDWTHLVPARGFQL